MGSREWKKNSKIKPYNQTIHLTFFRRFAAPKAGVEKQRDVPQISTLLCFNPLYVNVLYLLLFPTGKTFTYDNNGSLTKTTFGAKVTTYTYDYENRLTAYTLSIGGEGQGEGAYKYDYLGRRISKTVTSCQRPTKVSTGKGVPRSPEQSEGSEVEGSTETSNYVYDGDPSTRFACSGCCHNIIAEYDGNGVLIARYIFGPGIDEPIRMERLAPTRQICYYYFDPSIGSGSS